MKKIVLLSLALSAVIVFSFSLNSSGGQSIFGGKTPNLIHYRVYIYPTKPFTFNTCPAFVFINDIKGKMIAPAQQYQPGLGVYDFYELGKADGTRIAYFSNETDGNGQPPICVVVNIWESETGVFNPGSTYWYSLYP